jgi:hypothetical protein
MSKRIIFCISEYWIAKLPFDEDIERNLQHYELWRNIFFVFFEGVSKFTYFDVVPKDSENFVTNNYGAGRLFSVTKVFVIDSWRSAAVVISNEINLLLDRQ